MIWLSEQEREHKHPAQPKAIKGIVLGYSEEVKNGYLVLANKSVYCRRDIIVNENYAVLRSREGISDEFISNVKDIINLVNDENNLAITNIPRRIDSTFSQGYRSSSKDDSQLSSPSSSISKVVDQADSSAIIQSHNHPKVSYDDNLIPAIRQSTRTVKPVKRLLYNASTSNSRSLADLPKQPLIEYKPGDIIPPSPKSFHEAINEANQFKLYWMEACINEMNTND